MVPRRILITFTIIIIGTTVFLLPIFSHDPIRKSVEKHYVNTLLAIQNPWKEKITNSDELRISMEEAVKAKPVLIAQDDPKLIEYIATSGLIRTPSSEPYNLKYPEIKDQSKGQSAIILTALKNMTKGFFVECGALDGETRSNTLYFEKELGWTGLLIEGDPKNYEEVVKKGRKAYTINACLAIHPYAHEVTFRQSFNIGRISAESDGNKTKSGFANVQCFPFFSLMAAMKITTIDYFSLDIEGDEMKVLRNLPFDKVLIKTLSVEYIHGEGADPLEDFMLSKNYRLIGKVTQPDGTANDLLFIHRSLDEDS